MRKLTSLLLGFIALHAGLAFAQSDSQLHVWSVAMCASCHATADKQQQLASRITQPCREMCVSCHSMKGHHPVGVQIDRPVRPQLLLTSSGTNTCVTCHDVTRNRYERTTWTSQSLIQRLANRTGERKTFFLVMRNDRGQLCRNCH